MLFSGASHPMLKGHPRLTFKISVSSPLYHLVWLVWLAHSLSLTPSRMEIRNVLNFPSFPFKKRKTRRPPQRLQLFNSTDIPMYGRFTIVLHIKYIHFVFHCVIFFSSLFSLLPFKIFEANDAPTLHVYENSIPYLCIISSLIQWCVLMCGTVNFTHLHHLFCDPKYVYDFNTQIRSKWKIERKKK